MTIKEKREALKEYCNSQCADCTGCRLEDRHITFGVCFSDVTDEIINKNYEIVFGEESANSIESAIPLNEVISTDENEITVRIGKNTNVQSVTIYFREEREVE